MNTETKLKLNNIKNRLQRHQLISPDDLQWLITTLENTDFQLQQAQSRLSRLKKAVNDSQIGAIRANEAVKRILKNGDE